MMFSVHLSHRLSPLQKNCLKWGQMTVPHGGLGAVHVIRVLVQITFSISKKTF
jgi:hypothetical protein